MSIWTSIVQKCKPPCMGSSILSCSCKVENTANLTLCLKIMTHEWLLTTLLEGKDDAFLRSLSWLWVSSSCIGYCNGGVCRARSKMPFVRTFLWKNSSPSGETADFLYVPSARLCVRLWSYLFWPEPWTGRILVSVLSETTVDCCEMLSFPVFLIALLLM